MSLFSPSLKDCGAVARDLAMLIKSGIPLSEAMELLIGGARTGEMRRLLSDVAERVRGGTSLSEAFMRHSRIFGPLFVQVVRAGEQSGTLEENLVFLADLLEAQYELRSQVRLALLYPEIILVMSGVIASGLALFVLPKLTAVFTGLHIALPLPTRILLWILNFSGQRWPWLLGAAGAIAFGGILARRMPLLRMITDRIMLRLPLVGPFIKRYQIALIARVFSTLYRSGLSITDVLESSAAVAPNTAYRSALRIIGRQISAGVAMSQAFGSMPRLFPPHMRAVITVGERSGTLEEAFRNLAEVYQREVAEEVKRLPIVLEPILLVGIGLVVGFVAVSVILPVYSLTQGLQV